MTRWTEVYFDDDHAVTSHGRPVRSRDGWLVLALVLGLLGAWGWAMAQMAVR